MPSATAERVDTQGSDAEIISLIGNNVDLESIPGIDPFKIRTNPHFITLYTTLRIFREGAEDRSGFTPEESAYLDHNRWYTVRALRGIGEMPPSPEDEPENKLREINDRRDGDNDWSRLYRIADDGIGPIMASFYQFMQGGWIPEGGPDAMRIAQTAQVFERLKTAFFPTIPEVKILSHTA